MAARRPASTIAAPAPPPPPAPTTSVRARARIAEAGLQSEAMQKALTTALAGDERPLFAVLRRFSGLPGVRANSKLAEAFGESVAAAGLEKGLPLARGMLLLHADVAEGGTDLEYLPLCAVYALGALGARALREEARAAGGKGRGKGKRPVSAQVLELLHEAADDFRFRVRDAVPEALARLGEIKKSALAEELVAWTDGFFHGRAALLALVDPRFLHTIEDPAIVAARVDECMKLLRGAARSTSRFPGYKALLEALGGGEAAARKDVAPLAQLALAHGVAVVDALLPHAKTEEPAIREILEKCARDLAGSGRMADEARRIEEALVATKKAPRDPSRIVEGTRGRSKKR